LPKLLDLGIAKVVGADDEDDGDVGTGSVVDPLGSTRAELSGTPPPPPRLVPQSQIATLGASMSSSLPASSLEPLTEANAHMGSPPYMSPEQWIDAASVGPRADLYALGVVAYELLTGRKPFVGPTVAAYLELHTNAPVPTVGAQFPQAFDAFFRRALAKRPEDRPATALELAAALRGAAGLGGDPTDLPKLDEGIRDAWLADAPQPLAEAVAALDGARNVHQARDAARDVLRGLLRYLVAVALAARAQVRGEGDDRALLDQLRALQHHDFGDEERARLLRLLLRPFVAQPTTHPLPELVELVIRHDDERDALDAVISSMPTIDSSASEDAVRSQLAQLVASLAKFMRAASFVLDYPLIVPLDGTAERWTGLRRQKRAVATVHVDKRGELTDYQPMLIDRNGFVAVLAWPLVQVVAPTVGAEHEVFVFDGRGRHGARLVASPTGFEHQDADIWDWLGEHVIGEAEAKGELATDERAPYLGLASFSEADADRFVGREREVESFSNRLRQQALLVVVGASGAGKSSFVHAGVLPGLPAGWRAISFRPGAAPVANLASRLAAVKLPAETTVVVIDQLEELFTLCRDTGAREQFAAQIAELTRSLDTGVRVIGTVRDDFLMHLEGLAPLRASLSPALYLLGNPSRDDLVRTVVEPARRAGYVLSDDALAQDMVNAVADRPGALALLSFTASRLWELRDRRFRQLTRRAYDAMGGVGGALGQHAEQTLAALSADEQRVAREGFRHLVTANGTRAVLTMRELQQRLASARAEPVLDKLVAARLLSVVEAEGDAQIEITHEALIAAWPRLQQWVREDVDGARMREQLHEAARQWEERKRQPGLLWRGEALVDLERWRRRAGVALTETEAAFADASQAAATRGRRIRRAVLATLFVVLAGGVLVLVQLNRRAHDSAAEAARRLRDLRVEQGRQALLENDPMRALVYLSGAYSSGARGADLQFMIARATADFDAQQHVVDQGGKVRSLALSPDAALIAIASDKGTQLVDVATGKVRYTFAATRPVWSVAFSEDGARLIAGSDDKTAKIWDVKTGALLHTLDHPDRVRVTTFSPDGRFVATTCWDFVVRLWDPGSGRLVATMPGHTHIAVALAFDRTSTRLVSASADNTALLWSIPDAKQIAVLAHANWLAPSENSIRISPDGSIVATASLDKTAKLWDAATGRELRTLKHFDQVQSVDFSPDGARLVTVSDDKRVTIWNVASGDPIVTMLGHTDYVMGAHFTRDGKRVLSYGADGTARIWDASTGTPLATLVGHTQLLVSGAFDVEGSHVVTGSWDGTVRIWDARSRVATSVGAVGDIRPITIKADEVLVASEQGRPSARSLRTGELLATIERTDLPGRVIASPDRAYVIALGEQDVRICGARERSCPPQPNTARAQMAAFSPDSKQVLIGYRDRPAEIWTTNPPARVLQLAEGTMETLSGITYSPDGGRVAISHADNKIRIWNAKTGALVHTLVGHTSTSPQIVWSSDGRRLASASVDKTARVWDAQTGQAIAVLRGHTNLINSVALDEHGTFALTGSDDNTAGVWDVASGARLFTYALSTSVGWVAFASDRSLIITMGMDMSRKAPPTFQVWDAKLDVRSPQALAAYVRCRVPLILENERPVPAAPRCANQQ